jgi:predicted permease
MINNFWLDLRYTVRSLRKHAWLSVVVVATLTLGIGISTGVYTYFNAEFLRARVDKDFDSFLRVYTAYTTEEDEPARPGNATLEDYLAFRDGSKSLAAVAAYADFYAPLDKHDSGDIRTLLVTDNFFSVYNLEQPLMGRLLQAEDFAQASPVVVLSERVWRTRFAADPQIVGKAVSFNGQPVTVVGVTPTFAGMVNNARAWFPYTLATYLKAGDELLKPGEAVWLKVEGRLRPGFSRQEAAEELNLIVSQQNRLHPGRRAAVTVTDGSIVQSPGDRSGLISALTIIFAALAFFAIIACMNITTLLLSRAAARGREVAIRLALGVSRARLIRMLLTESFLLAAAAALAGLYIAYHMPETLRRWLITGRTGDLVDAWSLAPDWRAFVFLTLVTVFAGVMAGLTPALQSLRINHSELLKGQQSQPRRGSWYSKIFVLLIGAQVALSFFLLLFVGIAVRAYQKTADIDTGYETRQVLFATLWTNRVKERPSWDQFHRTMSDRIGALPGVQSVAYSNLEFFKEPVEALVQAPGKELRKAALNEVSPGYFETLGIPIVSGRELRHGDLPLRREGASVVVSQRLAREFFPSESPLGKTLQTRRGGVLEIVGVAKDVSILSLGGQDEPMIYAPWDPNARAFHPVVRYSGNPTELTRSVAAIVRDAAPDLSVYPETIHAMVLAYVEDLGRMVGLVVFVGILAGGLAIIGIYGVVSFAVSQRTKEWGIRLALGAQKRDLYAAIIKSSLTPIVIGLASGLAVTVASISAAAKFVNVEPFTLDVKDPLTYIGTGLLLSLVALCAMLVPARRATRVDPMKALRSE